MSCRRLQNPRVPGRDERPRRFLPVIEFIIDLLLNHGGMPVVRESVGRSLHAPSVRFEEREIRSISE